MKADIKQRALHRAKILQGQLKGVEKMIDKEEYCMDILTQSLAIQRSLQSLDKLLLENHLRTHITEKLESGNSASKEESIDELLKLYALTGSKGR